ncbi:ABC transporter permease subunit [Mesosutterella sp. AGMB02718]|uniref:ABC transporter permease subunit n=1 Tax=Mesosutterella faecium TaxID=2925194 RepID=A0ABT7IRR1_9BURK|nr:ABC transporter permease subunit [Mesosutterella sp. AGMB02718]MDL2059991.1 ABC transporter permease subunit [Mesosutterella sp. AGMB02718]
MSPACRKILHSRSAMACIGFLAFLSLLGLLAPVLPLQSPTEVNLAQKLAPWGSGHLFGTDQLGRDVFSRLIFGIRTTLFWSLAAMAGTLAAGALYGAAAGFFRGRTDSVMMRICDVFMSFPSEVLTLAIVGLMGPGITNMVLACILAKWAWYARMTRGIVRRYTSCGYTDFARVAGAGPLAIITGHLLPGAAGELLVLCTVDAGSVILLISTLSFLGLGVQPPDPEWGMMLAEAKEVLSLYPGQMVPPGLTVMATVAAFNYLGDALRDALDPKHVSGGASHDAA